MLVKHLNGPLMFSLEAIHSFSEHRLNKKYLSLSLKLDKALKFDDKWATIIIPKLKADLHSSLGAEVLQLYSNYTHFEGFGRV
ncbi:hypothetical protein AAC387_Pa07g3225 [Persea americana]